MSEAALIQEFRQMREVFLTMIRMHGHRLSRDDMCRRMDVCSKTLTQRVRDDKAPKPGRDGKWLLSEVIEWEALP